jgi:NADPH:quinone reductase-like Zn-dependent oxidoreductase
VDVVLDLVGGDYLGGNLRCAAEHARVVIVGLVAGATASLDMRTLMRKRMMVRGTVMRARPLHEKIAVARAFATAALPGFTAGVLRPVIDRVLPAHDAASAHALLEGNETFGKVVLDWLG